MKVTVEIDLPFLNEDGEMEDDLQEQIIKSCSAKIEQAMIKQIKPEIDEAFKNSIQAITDKILEDYLLKPVVISNGYKTENYESALSMIEQKFSSLYDREIKATSSCNGDPLMKKLEAKISSEVRNTISTLDNKIANEAKKIADQEVRSSALYVALEKLGHIK